MLWSQIGSIGQLLQTRRYTTVASSSSIDKSGRTETSRNVLVTASSIGTDWYREANRRPQLGMIRFFLAGFRPVLGPGWGQG